MAGEQRSRTGGIALKIWLSVAILVFGYLISVVVDSYFSFYAEEEIARISEFDVPAAQQSRTALAAFREELSHYQDAVESGEAVYFSTAETQAERVRQALGAVLQLPSLSGDRERETAAALESTEQYRALAGEVYPQLSQLLAGGLESLSEDAAADTLRREAGRINDLGRSAETALQSLTVHFSEDLNRRLLAFRQLNRQRLYLNIVVFAAVVVTALTLIAVLIRRSILRPLERTFLLERAMEQSADGISIADAQGRLFFCNRAWATMHHARPGELEGEPLVHMPEGSASQAGADALETVLREGGSRQYEAEHLRRDGSRFPCMMSVGRVRDRHGFWLVCIGRDVTEKHQREAQLRQANARILQLNEKLKAENLRMGAELDVSRKLQQMVLPGPEELAGVEGLDIAGFMEPADEVGGDYYDVIRNGQSVTIGIGDVTGHGLESGVVMLMTQTAIRTLMEAGETDPVRFLQAANRALFANVERMKADKSLTLSLMVYRNGELRLTGQHEHVIVFRRDGELEVVDTMDLGFPVALEPEIGSFLSETSLRLEPGDGVVLFTDGITEAEDAAGQLYGTERLVEIIRERGGEAAVEIQAAVIADVRRHIGGGTVYDDMTLVVLKKTLETENGSAAA